MCRGQARLILFAILLANSALEDVDQTQIGVMPKRSIRIITPPPFLADVTEEPEEYASYHFISLTQSPAAEIPFIPPVIEDGQLPPVPNVGTDPCTANPLCFKPVKTAMTGEANSDPRWRLHDKEKISAGSSEEEARHETRLGPRIGRPPTSDKTGRVQRSLNTFLSALGFNKAKPSTTATPNESAVAFTEDPVITEFIDKIEMTTEWPAVERAKRRTKEKVRLLQMGRKWRVQEEGKVRDMSLAKNRKSDINKRRDLSAVSRRATYRFDFETQPLEKPRVLKQRQRSRRKDMKQRKREGPSKVGRWRGVGAALDTASGLEEEEQAVGEMMDAEPDCEELPETAEMQVEQAALPDHPGERVLLDAKIEVGEGLRNLLREMLDPGQKRIRVEEDVDNPRQMKWEVIEDRLSD